jgi:SAM-dependent methyltransferase
MSILSRVLTSLTPRPPQRIDERPPATLLPLLSIDVGCGAKKRPGYVGVDALPVEGVDHVLDLASQPLPFADQSVGQIFSSHCIEHVHEPLPLLRELTRVSSHGARIELWAPYSWHGDAHFYSHVSPFNERQFLHMGVYHPAYWATEMGAKWALREVVFSIFPHVLEDLEDNGVSVGFALRYFKDVAHEMGIVVEIDRHDNLPTLPPLITYAPSRAAEDRRPLPSKRERRLGGLVRRLSSPLMGRPET